MRNITKSSIEILRPNLYISLGIGMNPHYLVAQIDLAAIEHNCRLLRWFAPNSRLCAAVKANAYGHGIDLILPAMTAAEVDMLAVAAICEAQELRRLGWSRPILLMGCELSAYAGPEGDQWAQWLVENEIRVTAMSLQVVEMLIRAAEKVLKPAIVHLMLDTGMSREGIYEQPTMEIIRRLKDVNTVTIEGLYTHLSTADASDKRFAQQQLQRFRKFLADLSGQGVKIPIIHAANSAATIDLPESHFDMIRPGISIYGYQPSRQMHNHPDLRPAMRVVSVLTIVKQIPAGSYIGYGCTYQAPADMVIGLVPIGYADGYDRRFSNNATMTIADQSVPVIGRVSMDQTIVDLTELDRSGISVCPGRQVIIIDYNRDSANSVESLADLLDTIPYEITTSLGARVKRLPAGNNEY